MTIVLVGVNHKTAPVELRERLAIPPEQLADAMRSLAGVAGVHEGMILSTCNRVELVACQDAPTAEHLLSFFQRYFSINPAELLPHLYQYQEEEAVRHLFRVASSLDSMVVGEPQILGQVKESYTIARSVGAVRGNLEKLLQCAFAVAKKVRTETQIGSSSVSIASVAVDLAKKIFGSLDGKCVMLVGAGKMSELAARHLIQQGAGSILVANRTYERAVKLAQDFGGRAVRFEDLLTTADQADIIITSTGSPKHIFKREHGQKFLQRRRHRPMFFVDIAVPRDVDPEMNKVDGVFLYDIDDLQSVTASHLADRVREAESAEGIIAREVEQYQRRLQTLNVVPAIVGLQQTIEDLRLTELRRNHARLQSLTPEQQAAVDSLTRGMMNKFLHLPLQALKAAARDGDVKALKAICAAFELDTQSSGEDVNVHSIREVKREESPVAEQVDHTIAAAMGEKKGRA